MGDYAHISRPADGVQIVADTRDQPGVHMAEGHLSPLIWGEQFQSYIVDMPPGAYLEEHPHSFEALIYTVQGRFVLCTNGRRQVLEAGSLISFGANVASGYEVPFGEPATVLVFRSEAPTEDQISFMERFPSSSPPNIRDLAADHPARIFSRKINPSFK